MSYTLFCVFQALLLVLFTVAATLQRRRAWSPQTRHAEPVQIWTEGPNTLCCRQAIIPFATAAFLLALGLLMSMSMPWEDIKYFSPMTLGVPAVLLLLRKGIVLNAQDRTVTRWWGLLVPFSRYTAELEEDAHVLFTTEWRPGRSGLWETKNHPQVKVCAVYLRPAIGDELVINAACSVAEGCRTAERVAEALDVPLIDETAEPPETRTAEELRTPFRQRVASGRVALTCPEAPPAPLSRQLIDDDSLAYDIPNRHYPKVLPLKFVLLIGWVSLIVVLAFLEDFRTLFPLWIGLGVMGAALLQSRPIPPRGWLVVASPVELSVCVREFMGSRIVRMPADSVKYLQLITTETLEGRTTREELDGLPHAILVSHVGGNVVFGTGLGFYELEWVKATIEVALNAD